MLIQWWEWLEETKCREKVEEMVRDVVHQITGYIEVVPVKNGPIMEARDAQHVWCKSGMIEANSNAVDQRKRSFTAHYSCIVT